MIVTLVTCEWLFMIWHIDFTCEDALHVICINFHYILHTFEPHERETELTNTMKGHVTTQNLCLKKAYFSLFGQQPTQYATILFLILRLNIYSSYNL